MADTNQFQRLYETPRLYLRILDDSNADAVLTFLNKGALVFDEYESSKPSDYYTTLSQKKILRAELELANQKKGVRFYVFDKTNPDEIIGTLSISSVRQAPHYSGTVGYKFRPTFWHQGYATEALEAIIEITHSVLGLHRFNAYVLPENKSSCRLLTRVGFHLQDSIPYSLEVNGVRRDHLQYIYNIP